MLEEVGGEVSEGAECEYVGGRLLELWLRGLEELVLRGGRLVGGEERLVGVEDDV